MHVELLLSLDILAGSRYDRPVDASSRLSFEGPGCLVARQDYGYPEIRLPGWREADLGRSDLLAVLAGPKEPGLVLRRAELLGGWLKTRSGALVRTRLKELARASGLVLECRFPKHARRIHDGLRIGGARPILWERPASGQVPPLYIALTSRPDLLELHLEHEWWSAMGVARGGVALLRIAIFLATHGAASAPQLAESLGISSGAVRSYLQWMEDAALIRRDGRDVHLRHPLLSRLFESAAIPPPAPPRHAMPEKIWNPAELD